MGIVNVTPDSFSDGGAHASHKAAQAHCDALLAQGAGMLDIGGESTRPGAVTPTPEEEWQRVGEVLAYAVTLGVPVSVDTSEPLVMRRAIDLGVDVVNDVRALTRPGAVDALAANATVGACLMHMRGTPGTMQSQTDYVDVVDEVGEFLRGRLRALAQAGLAENRVALDPGIGFAKTVSQNFELLQRQDELARLGLPLLVGWSRKSSLGAVTGQPVGERMIASVAAALLAVERGARIVRVHDVAATRDALAVWQAARRDSTSTQESL